MTPRILGVRGVVNDDTAADLTLGHLAPFAGWVLGLGAVQQRGRVIHE